MLGGSSSHNGMTYARGNVKYDTDYWSSLGNKGWDYDTVMQYYRRWEGNRNPDIANYDNGFYHGQTGPVNVSYFWREPGLQTILDGAIEAGKEQIKDNNADKTVGYVYLQGFQYHGVRSSAATSYLIPAMNRPNLCIVKNAIAYKILFDKNRRAIGVQYEYKGTRSLTAYARREVIVSAGTIESTKLLLLSGIGPISHLAKFNIPTISDLPVGENLHDHVSVYLYFQFEENYLSANQSFDDMYEYFFHRTGPYSVKGGKH